VRESFAAPYLQIKQRILRQIADGSLKPGTRVPSENELVAKLKVARMTANRALRELADEGIVVRVAGVGTFVSDQRAHTHPLLVRSIADEIHERGHTHRMRLVTKETVDASPEIAARCGVPAGSRLNHTLIVHYEGDLPLQVEDRYVNPRVIPGYLSNDFSRVTPHDFLMQVAPLLRAEHTVRAVTPDARTRRLLDLPAHAACLLILRRTWSDGRVATIADLYHPGSRYELTAAFAAPAPHPLGREGGYQR
jgi:GntR family histidine utilization transcriptional repressor